MEDKKIKNKKIKKQPALYPGSFDPVTYGHLDLIERLSRFYSPFVVLAAKSPWKTYYFSFEERVSLLKECLKGFSCVEVDSCSGLVVEYAKKHDIRVFIRGVRAVSDFEYEMDMANNNKTLYPESETLIAFTQSKYTHFSSKMVQELAVNGADISHLVPPNVHQAILKKEQLRRESKA